MKRRRRKYFGCKSPREIAGFFVFKQYRPLKLFKKSVALTLAFTFIYSQVIWALDVRQLLWDAKASFEEEDTRRGDGFSGDQLEQTQSLNEAEIAHQEALQELIRFNLKTENGDLLTYVGDKLSEVRRPDGTRLQNIELDENGNVIGADLRLADGSIQIYGNGQVLGYMMPDGTQVLYEHGLVQRVISREGLETEYAYVRDADGALLEMVLDNTYVGAHYTPDGQLVKSFNKQTLSETQFSDGLIEDIVFQDGSRFFFKETATGDGIRVTFDRRVDAQGNVSYILTPEEEERLPFKEALYDSETRSVKAIWLADGTRFLFDEGGLLREVVDAQGDAAAFDFTQSDLANIVHSRIVQNGLASGYDAEGRLSSVTIDGLTVYYKNGQIDYLAKDDGTELYDLYFDENGALLNATIVTPDGEVRVYQNGELVSVTQPDYTKLFYFDEQLTTLITPGELTYTFNYTADRIEAVLEPAAEAPDALTPVRMVYDSSFNLQQIIRQNQEILNYLDNELFSIQYPDAEEQVFSYEKDEAGNVLSYTVTQGFVETRYDAQDNPVRAFIHASEGRPDELEITYRYGKIREIYKNGTLTFKYSYSFENGVEKTLIEDLEENSLKTYENGRLLTSFESETSVLSTYFYEAGGRVERVEVTRLGRPLHTYSYSYEGEWTIVEDEEGVIRTYDADHELVFLEKEGRKFGYEYWQNPDGSEIVEEKLLEMSLDGGARAYFDDGRISRIEFADGSVLSGVVYEDGAFKQASVQAAGGSAYVIDALGSVIGEILPDGSRLYFEAGRLVRAEHPEAGALDFSVDYDESGNPVLLHIYRDGYELKYDPSGALLGIHLPGVPRPEDILAQTTYVTQKGSNPVYGYDGDFNTAQVGGRTRLYSEHHFPSPQTVTGFTYRLSANAWSNGDTDNGSTAETYLEYLDASTGEWTLVEGSKLRQNHNNGGGGGSTARADTQNPATLAVTLENVAAIRGVAFAAAYTNGSGGTGGSTAIWEVQAGLLDQSFVTDADEIASHLGEAYDALTRAPYLERLSAPQPAQTPAWLGALADTVFDSNLVIVQEYSTEGVLEVQKKADQTYTLFEDNKPSKVLDDLGRVLIEYTYDAEGNPSKVYLRHAREVLPGEIEEARLRIEEQRADALRDLVAERDAAYETIFAQSKTQKDLLKINRSDLEAYYNSTAAIEVKGSAARSQKADALSQLRGSIDEINGYIRDVNRQEADAYAALDSQVRQLSDEITSDAEAAFTELAVHEENLKREILRQEVSPIVYDYYRRILGRDPSAQEYEDWITKIDYETNLIKVGEDVSESIVPVASMYFDTSWSSDNKNVSIPDSSGLDLSQGNWTIDMWFNYQGSSWSSGDLFYQGLSWNHSIKASISSGRLKFIIYKNGTFVVTGSTSWSDKIISDTWYHLAITQSEGHYYLYLNGELVKDIQDPDLPADYEGDFRIGMGSSSSNRFKGYISEFRVSQGIARWTGQNFDVPSGPAVPDSYTSLLVRESEGEVKDLSANNLPVTMNGVELSADNANLSQTITTRTPILRTAAEALTDHLDALPELSERQAYVQAVKDRVALKVSQYLSMSDSDRSLFAASLGLGPSDLIALSEADAQKILVWINSRSLHFGQSAFLSIEELLDQKGISYAREDIAERAILIDILSGIITPLDDGDLVISVFALNKVASLYGVDLLGAQLSFEDLFALYQWAPDAKLIAHINGNHFVVITGITQDMITYIDTGIGKDKENEVVTLSKKEFLKVWKGYVTADAGIIQDAVDNAVIAGGEAAKQSPRVLSVEETKRIRGAFFGFLALAVFGAFEAIGGAVWAVMNGIGFMLAGLGEIVGAIVTNIGYGLQTLLEGIGSLGYNLFQSIKFAASTLFGNPQGLFANFSNQSFFGGVSQAVFGDGVFSQVVSAGLNFAVAQGLDGLGLPAELSNYLSVFTTGGILENITQGAFNLGNFFSAGFDKLFASGFTNLGSFLNLEPNLEIALNILTDGFVDGLAVGDFGGSFAAVGENLASSLSYYGITELGDYLGLDPSISGVIGLPIAGAIGRSFDTGRIAGEDLIQSVVDGLTGGVLQLGLDFAIDELDIDNPLLESLTSAVVTSTVSSLLDPNGSVFEDLMKEAKDATIDFLTEIQSSDFAQMVLDYGIEEALESTVTSMFSRQALEEIYSVGGIAQLISGRAMNFNLNGVTITEVRITDEERFYLDSDNTLYAVYKNGELKTGQFYKTEDGRVFLMNGTIEKVLADGQREVIQVQNGSSVNVSYGIEGQPIIEIKVNNQGELKIGDFYDVRDGIIYLPGTQSSIEVDNGYITHMNLGTITLPEGFDAGDIDFGSLTTEQTKQIIQLVLLNGIREGFSQAGVPPNYFDPTNPNSFVGILADADVNPNTVKVIPMFDENGFGRDMLSWIVDWFGLNNETSKIIQNLNQIDANQAESFVPLAYSGSGQPLLKALDTPTLDGSYYNVDTVIMVGSPSNKTEITNPNIDTIINVYGQWDVFLEENILNIDTWQEFLVQAARSDLELLTQAITAGSIPIPRIQHNYTGVSTINIELLGIGHTEYFKDPNKTYNGNELVLKAEQFLALLSAFSSSGIGVDGFLADFPRDENNVIIVDLQTWELPI